MSDLIIEQETFTPKFTWLGGYGCAFGVNRGDQARLDSTLQWLIQADGNNLHYPVKYGELPQGATDITNVYGGHFERLIEDSTYTFWIVKEDAWGTVVENAGKLILEAELDSVTTMTNEDTLWIDSYSYVQKSCWIDVYTNIDMASVKLRGAFAKITITETDTSNSPVITWKITDSSVDDSLVAAVGVCVGESYDPKKIVWEIWSVDTTGGQKVYGKNNVINQPLVIGSPVPGTRVFVECPSKGLSRNKTYLFWMAGKDWNGVDHLRSTKYHSYITFNTW
ncbi:MAG TPA: hypothetical protein P5268_00660 [Candidatus Marinimicrobia bacterium]|nr:hypothetical protein [Candidatus Neomarinimicrobiota bacterium]HRU91523.1 hypothetical protein [Candidatus Neomarinimicrobiota bacterium]